MAYDEELADRIRFMITPGPELSERKMFGGLSFLIGGNMAVAASGQGGLLVRVDPKESDELLAHEFVEPMVMGGREMAGWLRVTPEAADDDAVLREWVDRGVGYARSLPPKKKK
ncbi:TfoX/Sxy family transcriptional regulator of competence genes [Nocardia tenerifensis]|uniref:TfoX/Sxy family transcriptional regulator of competence genes n=1 Tax=Nocardia tenerifensis TaxID=228006 RepID=A0A318K8K5_9NOCA|nr:TfoX/Sxy family protein [Nocardia tenerifensis]PXX69044.1 TfoX/Sxy family transcriptional regulator of competence genes [Nocardia tenerifensis]